MHCNISSTCCNFINRLVPSSNVLLSTRSDIVLNMQYHPQHAVLSPKFGIIVNIGIILLSSICCIILNILVLSAKCNTIINMQYYPQHGVLLLPCSIILDHLVLSQRILIELRKLGRTCVVLKNRDLEENGNFSRQFPRSCTSASDIITTFL